MQLANNDLVRAAGTHPYSSSAPRASAPRPPSPPPGPCKAHSLARPHSQTGCAWSCCHGLCCRRSQGIAPLTTSSSKLTHVHDGSQNHCYNQGDVHRKHWEWCLSCGGCCCCCCCCRFQPRSTHSGGGLAECASTEAQASYTEG